MTQALRVEDRHKVLEVGTGSGYQACVLAPLCRRLYTVERLKSLGRNGGGAVSSLQARQCDDPRGGWFPRVAGTGAFRPHHGHRRSRRYSRDPLEQLVAGGIMVVPVDALDGPHQRLLRVVRTDEGRRWKTCSPSVSCR